MNRIKNLSSTTKSNIFTYGLIIVGYIVLQTLLSAGALSYSLQGMLIPICAWIIMAVSLTLTVGIMGELSIGHAGFMCVGAFSGIIALVSLEAVIPFVILRVIVAMLIGALCAGFVGLLVGIPVLRLRGDYVAIVTLAFGEIIKNLVICLYVGMDHSGLRFGFLLDRIDDLHLGEGARTIVNGPQGLINIPYKIVNFSMGFVLILITLFIILNLVNSRAGRAIMALRDNRIAAESVGIPVTKYKLIAFVTSAALAGAAGTLYAMNLPTVMAGTQFGFLISIQVLVFVVLGGLKNFWGSIIAAVLLTVLPEFLRFLNEYRLLMYGVLLVVVMLTTYNNNIRYIILRPFRALGSLIAPKRGKEGGIN
jgi:branched-chain amino acid transport system permease protein